MSSPAVVVPVGPVAASDVKLVLLGDATLGSAAPASGGLSIAAMVLDSLEEAALPRDPARRAVAGLAVEGADAAAVLELQLPALPTDATHAVLCVGGADAAAVCAASAPAATPTVAEALLLLGRAQSIFEGRYMAIVAALTQQRRLPLLLLVPHVPRYAAERDALVSKAGLSFFSDVIYRAAAKHSCSVLDLRLVLDNAPADLSADLSARALSPVGAMKVVARLMEFVVKASLAAAPPAAAAALAPSTA